MTNIQSTTKEAVRRKILITASLLTLARIGNYVPLPYIDREIFTTLLNSNNLETKSLLSVLQSFSGNGGSSFGLLSVGILPSINASIIMQVLSITLPSLEKLKKEEGEYGRRKLNDYTRRLTLLCAFIQSLSISYNLRSLIFNWNFWTGLEMTLSLTAGSMIILWISELITRNGVGTGSSLLICANILSTLPVQLKSLIVVLQEKSPLISLLYISFFYLTTFLCVMINEARVEIPLISATQLSRKIEKEGSKQKNVLPLKVNQAGVLPLAFASSLMIVFSSFTSFLKSQVLTDLHFTTGIEFWVDKLLYWSFFGGSIFVSTYIYATVVLEPKEIAKQFQKNSVIIRGVPPGEATKEYLTITLRGLAARNASFLLVMTLFLNISQVWVGNINSRGFGLSSQIILVGAVIDTLQKLRSSFGQEENSENSV